MFFADQPQVMANALNAYNPHTPMTWDRQQETTLVVGSQQGCAWYHHACVPGALPCIAASGVSPLAPPAPLSVLAQSQAHYLHQSSAALRHQS
jgi:hypothetical protein